MIELWTIVSRLQIDCGFLQIDIESDSMTTLSLISNGCSLQHITTIWLDKLKIYSGIFHQYSLIVCIVNPTKLLIVFLNLALACL